MRTETTLKLVLTALIVCVLGLGAQTYYVWRLDRQYAGIVGPGNQVAAGEKLTPLEEKILESADDSQPVPDGDPFGFGSDPFAGIQAMQQHMDELFESVFGSPPLPGGNPGLLPGMGQLNGGNTRIVSVQPPEIQIRETDREYRISVMVPDSENVEINTEVEGNTLSISGRVQQKIEDSQGGRSTALFSQSRFSRRFPLDKEVDEFGISTEQTPAGLMIRIPKKPS